MRINEASANTMTFGEVPGDRMDRTDSEDVWEKELAGFARSDFGS